MTVYNLVKRNFLIFFRDRSAVFFSLLSMFIVIMLMAVFLGDMNVEEVVGLLEQYGGPRDTALDRERAGYLVTMWTLSGILVVNSVTVSVSVMEQMVLDAGQHRLSSFYVAPVKRIEIVLGYILASVLVSTLICVLTLVFSEAYVWITGGVLPGLVPHVKILGLILLNCCVFSSLMFLMAVFVKSSSAWGAIGTIIGTLVGFVGAIYLPIGMLPDGVAAVLKYLPVLHSTSLMRQIFTSDAISELFGPLQPLAQGYREAMGIRVVMGGTTLSAGVSVCIVAAFGIAALIAAALLLKYVKRTQK